MDKNELIRKALRVKVGSQFKYQKELNELGLELRANGDSTQGYYTLVNDKGMWNSKKLVISTTYARHSRLFDPYSLAYGQKGTIKSDLNQDLAKFFGV